MGFYAALPKSFGSKVFSNETGAALKSFNFGNTIDSKFTSGFGIDKIGQFSSVANALTGKGALAKGGGWTFITAPEDISWDVANQVTRVDIFGTNNPPVVAGSRGMRDLTLSNSLVEGFVRGVTVEAKVASLEALMNYSLNTSDGFVSVPVYQVWANQKSYGGPEAYYIIKDIKIKEAMRDLKGNSTRAYVDISLTQVPAYQVNSGRDQASRVTAGGVALTPAQKAQIEAAKKKGTDGTTAAAAAAAQADKGATPKGGPGTPPPKPAVNPAPTWDGRGAPPVNLDID